MNQFIIVTCSLILLNPDIEDEKLQHLTGEKVGDTRIMINISQIEQAFEIDGGCAMTLISGVQIQTKETFNELLTKISEAQIKSRIN